jgi:hypothetical protein
MGGWTLPQALQKCAARMSPHDQQEEVASPGMINDEPALELRFAIDTFTTAARVFLPLEWRKPAPW